MTTPVTLYGTQSNGETLPVQVNEFGQLVAEGLQGPEGPKGDKGDQGDQGPKGEDGGMELPPDPQEGEVLGWENGQLSWISLVPPEPSVLFTGTINPSPNGGRRVINENGADVTGSVTDYDAWFRSQSFFPDTPTANKGFGTTGGNNTDWWEMDILNATGMVLTVSYWYRFASESNGARFTWNCTPNTSHIVQIGGKCDNLSMSATGGLVYREGTTQFTYLINRPELLNVRFSLTSTISAPKPSDTRAYMAGYKIESTEGYILRKLAARGS